MLALAGAATADPDAAAIWRKNLDDRRHGMSMFAAELAGDRRADGRPSTPWPTSYGSPWTYATTTGWSANAAGRRFQRWYVDTVGAAILGRSAMEPPDAG